MATTRHVLQTDLENRAKDLLLVGLRSLLKEAINAGHWDNVQCTADGLIAIDQCLPDLTFPELRRAAADWLVGEQKEEVHGVSWEKEIWHTSVSVMALAHAAPEDKKVAAAGARFLVDRFHAGRNWNDEPWETSFALLALASLPSVFGDPQSAERVRTALRWLMELIGSPRPNMLLTPHYTALFTLVAERYGALDDVEFLGADLLFQLTAARHLLVDGLLEDLAHLSAGRDRQEPTWLWTQELWSNSLVIWALAECDAFADDTPNLALVIDWIEAHPSISNTGDQDSGNQTVTEDLAFACVALFHLLVSLAKNRISSFRDVRASREPSVDALLEKSGQQAAQDMRQWLSGRLSPYVSDHCPKPPLCSLKTHPGYVSFNVSSRGTGVFLVVVGTAILTAATLYASNGWWGRWASLAVVSLGSLAVLAQLFSFNIHDFFKRRRST